MIKKLSELNIGEEAKILAVEASGISSKLTEMGLIENATISMRYKAPFGDPMAFYINGYTLSLRKDEANLVKIEL